MIRARTLPAWQAYVLALAASLTTTVIAVLAARWLGPAAWLLFAVPVALGAWVGGFGPGALATLVSVLGLSYFLSPPIASLGDLSVQAVVPVAAAALALAFLTAWVARARQAALQASGQAARAAGLAQASLAFSNAVQPQAVLETFARELAAALPLGLLVQSLTDDGETLLLAAAHHPNSAACAALREAYTAAQKAADSLGAGALADGQAAALTGVSAEQLRTGIKARYWPNLEPFARSHVLLVPLYSQGRVLGLATLLRPEADGSFRDDEQAYVVALAERAAAALLAVRHLQAEVQQRQAAEAAAVAARRLQGLAGALAGANTAEQVAAVQLELAQATTSEDENERAGRYLLAQQGALVLDRIGQAEAGARARDRAEHAAARLRELQAATAALSQALTLEEVLDRALRHGLALAQAEAGAISLLRGGQPPLELARSSGYTEVALRGLRSLRLDQPAAEARVAASGEPVWLPDREACIAAFPQFAHAYASLRCDALAVLPLSAAGKVLGTLTLAFDGGRLPAPEERDMLLAFAGQGGLAVSRAARHDQERSARAAAEADRGHALFLAEVGDTLASSLNLPVTLQNVARLSVTRLADFSLVFALGNDGMALGWAHAHRDPEREALLASSVRLLLTLPGQQRGAIQDLVRAGRPLHIPDLTDSMLASLPEENGLRRVAQELAPRALLLLPLLSEGRPLGVIVLCATEAGRFAAARQALAEALAQRASRAVEHALRHAVAQSLNAELEERVNERTEELQETIAKLEEENTQRQRAQAQLETSREQLRSLSARLQAAREEERSRIAREVHDELGQQLAGIKMDIAWLRKKLREQQEPLLRKAKGMADLIDTTMQSVRKITQELRPGILDDFGLLAAIEWQLQEFQTRHNLETRLTSEVDEPQLDPESATAVFRVFQETLSNVAKHAQATRVDVTLERIDDQLILQVEDNGRGITDRELYGAASLGLLGMRERIHLLAGAIDIRGVPGEGTAVLVRIPLPRGAPAPSPNGDSSGEPAAGSRTN